MKEKIQELPVFISRQELASMLGVSGMTIKNHEKEWGLDRCRVQWNLRHVRYVRSIAIESVMKAVGLRD